MTKPSPNTEKVLDLEQSVYQMLLTLVPTPPHPAHWM